MRLKFAVAAALLSSTANAQVQPAAPVLGTFGVDIAGGDRSVRPGDDFWEYANGTWAKTTTIPADAGNYSQVLRLNNLASDQVQAILAEMQTRRSTLTGDDARMVDYFAALTDEAAINRIGAAPLLADLAPLRTADRSALAALMGRMRQEWQPTPSVGRMPRTEPSLFTFDILQDFKVPERYVVGFEQGGLGLPDKEYYSGSDAKAREIQAAYRDFLATMLGLIGADPATVADRAQAIYAFERALAASHWSIAESRDLDKLYNLFTLEALQTTAPGFDWAAFFGAAGVGDRPIYNVGQPSAIKAMAATWATTPVPVLRDWLAVRIASDRSLVLPKVFQDTLYGLVGALTGTTEPPPRRMQALELTGAAMTDAVSRPYVARHFPPRTKAMMDEMVSNILAAMDRRLAGLSWMSPETKVKARAKLATFTPMIGYPSEWRSYDGLVVDRGDAYGNFKRAGVYDWKRRVARIDRPVDRDEWWMMPIIANAYASFNNNQIVFAAAYLQAPHFDPNADPAVNYGAIGSVIGHEISHHFDDQGSKFDAQGQLKSWWTERDLAAFKARTARLVAQYNAYEPLPGLHVRGAQTLGENIADNAGVTIAYDAYRMSLKGKPAPIIDGTTGDQRFYLGRAQVGRAMSREDALRTQVMTGVHSPSRYRTWGVRNYDSWYEAFGVKPGDKMYLAPADRVIVWE